jgi:hypothetical protein
MSEIIKFPGAVRPARRASHKPTATEVTAIGKRILTPMQLRHVGKPELPPPATETAKNARIGNERRDAWWLAERTADYWRPRIDWNHALGAAQHWGIADSISLPPAKNENLHGLGDTWRDAVVKRLLTPAPIGAAVAWNPRSLPGEVSAVYPSPPNGWSVRSPMMSHSSPRIRLPAALG